MKQFLFLLLRVLLLLLIIGVPIFLWIRESFYAESFMGLTNTTRSLGQIAGLVGATLLTLNFILAARFRLVETIMGGLNRIYVVHHYIGAVALIALLFHPILLMVQYLVLSVEAAARFLLPPTAELAIWFGIAALTVMTILLIITFYFRIEYQKWKLSHKLLGVTLMLTFLHVLLISGDLDTNATQRAYLLITLTLGLVAYFYRSVFNRFLVRRIEHTVKDVISRGSDIMEISFTPTKRILTYEPGQFLFIKVYSRGVSSEEHPFSISSPKKASQLSVAAKSLGDYTETLKLIKPNSKVLVEGPFGHFLFTNTGNNKQIWVAGGIGITPFLSMARSLSPETPFDVTLFYTVSTADEAVYRNELEEIDRRIEKFRLVVHPSKEKGRLTAQMIATTVPDFQKRDIFLCGPPPMMASLRQQFRALKVKNHKIHSEEFNLY